MTDKLYQVALSKTPQIGPVLARTLMAHCGSAEAVFKTPKKQLLKIPNIGLASLSGFNNKQIFEAAENEISHCLKHNTDILFYTDKEYPQRLKHFDYSPILLYKRGTASLNPARSIGIVGTRKPTFRGVKICEKIVQDLINIRATTISGLAFGIDAIAHRKSVEMGIPTVAVLGHGLDITYPAQHRQLAEKIQDRGALITEFGIDTKPDRVNFPMRNRIIAALSDGLLVVESKKRGGSMITAEFANEYNKDVFAVPGSPEDVYSAGCNSLIKRQKAHLAENVADMSYIMGWEETHAGQNRQTTLFADLTEEEASLVDVLRTGELIELDRLCQTMKWTGSVTARILLQLELKGVVKSLPGKRYALIV